MGSADKTSWGDGKIWEDDLVTSVRGRTRLPTSVLPFVVFSCDCWSAIDIGIEVCVCAFTVARGRKLCVSAPAD